MGCTTPSILLLSLILLSATLYLDTVTLGFCNAAPNVGCMDQLDVAYNELSGRVPNSLRFIYPATVDLSSNLFEGPLPLWSSNVTSLDLRSNQFSGPIPDNFGHFLDKMKYALIDFASAIGKHLQKISNGTEES
ncbi:hypothetical protein M0R45_033820 [Rubus argutus]|uniref:Uncharacterized protein n=1 Tax=Rubus argutus TaxID=59490 RepID=A0AAW1WPJ5_RUBAR